MVTITSIVIPKKFAISVDSEAVIIGVRLIKALMLKTI
jgi:hypothetical protein